MTLGQKMELIRNSNEYATLLSDQLAVHYSPNGFVFAEHNAEICEKYNPKEETYMVGYKYSDLAKKVLEPKVMWKIIATMPTIKDKFGKWLEKVDKNDANCPISYGDVFLHDLFPADEVEVLDDEVEENELAEETECNGSCVFGFETDMIIPAILMTLEMIDKVFQKRNL